MRKKILFLSISVFLAVITIIVLNITSNYRPYKKVIAIDNQVYTIDLPSVNEGPNECLIELPIEDTTLNGYILYRKYKTDDEWNQVNFVYINNLYNSIIPNFRPTFRVEYYMVLIKNKVNYTFFKEKPLVITFIQKVPRFFSFSFYLLTFAALIFACFTLFYFAFDYDSKRKYMLITFWLFLVSSIIFGPIIQLYWIDFKLLTLYYSYHINILKSLLGFFIWWGAISLYKKNENKWFVVTAVIIVLILFLIPLQWFVY